MSYDLLNDCLYSVQSELSDSSMGGASSGCPTSSRMKEPYDSDVIPNMANRSRKYISVYISVLLLKFWNVTFCSEISLNTSLDLNIWAATWQNQQMSVRPAKTQISLGIRPVWSESLLCAQWVAKDPSFLHADSEDSDQTEGCPGWS